MLEEPEPDEWGVGDRGGDGGDVADRMMDDEEEGGKGKRVCLSSLSLSNETRQRTGALGLLCRRFNPLVAGVLICFSFTFYFSSKYISRRFIYDSFLIDKTQQAVHLPYFTNVTRGEVEAR